MKRFVFALLLFLPAVNLSFSQEVAVQVVNSDPSNILSWSINDSIHNPVINSSMFLPGETASFYLDQDKHFYLEVSISESQPGIPELLSLSLNYEVIMIIGGDLEAGDYSFPFFSSEVKTSKKIIGGTAANIAEFPWQVFLRADNYICGGSIIGEDWVVTAAHCVFDDEGDPIDVSKMSVKVGATNIGFTSTQGKLYTIKKYVVHENYDPESLENDIAVLKISEAIDFENAESIELITKQDSIDGYTDPGILAWVTGWGLTNIDPRTFPDILQKVQLPIVSLETAAGVWGPRPSSMLMAGYRAGTKDACNGDSGGPLIVPVGETYKLAGIVSWGNTNCNTYGGYTRISSFYEWIRVTTGINDTYKPDIPAGDKIICEGQTHDNYSTNSEPLASDYEWKLTPDEAGMLFYSDNTASIEWNTDYLGDALLEVRNTVDGVISSWSELELALALNTVLNSQSGDTTICAGETLNLDIKATGYKLVFDWYKDDILVKTGNSSQILYSNPVAANSGLYRCEIKGGCGTILTDDMDIIIHPLTEINAQSFNQTINYGDQASIMIDAVGHDLQIDWYQNDNLLELETGQEIMLNSVNASNIGVYKAVVTGTCGIKETSDIYLYVSNNENSGETVSQVWPTISDGLVNIAVKDAREYSLTVYASNGYIVRQFNRQKYHTSLDLSHFKGLFFIRLTGKDLDEIYRVVIAD